MVLEGGARNDRSNTAYSQRLPCLSDGEKLRGGTAPELEFDYKDIEVYTPEGLQLIRQYSIRSVPTTLIDKKVEFVGVPDRDAALSKVNCADSKH